MVIERGVDDHQRVRPAERSIKLPRTAQQLVGDRQDENRLEPLVVFGTNSQRRPEQHGDHGSSHENGRHPGRCLRADAWLTHHVLAHEAAAGGRPRGFLSIIFDPGWYARASH